MFRLTLTCALVILHNSTSQAQSIVRVSGDLISVAIADSGGRAFFENCVCGGSDAECDVSEGWSSSSASVIDPDITIGVGECCNASVATPACAYSTLQVVNISGTEKNIVWTPKAFGTRVTFPSYDAVSSAWAFNDLVLKVSDSANPTHLYNVDVRLQIQSTEEEPQYVQCGIGSEIILSVDVALTGNETRELPAELNCAEGLEVSDWEDETLYYHEFGQGCHSIQEDQEWMTLGTVCQGATFRLGFRMMLQGTAPSTSYQTEGDDDDCSGDVDCDGTQPIRVVLGLRVQYTGTNCE